MILGGDEIGRTQGGNNNAYCQDNEISWFDWERADRDLLAFTTELITLRRENPALRPDWFRHAPEVDERRPRAGAPRPTTTRSRRATGSRASTRRSRSCSTHKDADAFALLLNGRRTASSSRCPRRPHGEWELAASSDPDQQVEGPVTTLIVRDASFTLLRQPRLLGTGESRPEEAGVASSGRVTPVRERPADEREGRRTRRCPPSGVVARAGADQAVASCRRGATKKSA